MTWRIKNWEKFQHFKDRSPPWIKLYREILDDPDWHELPPKLSKTLVMAWLLASEQNGALPSTRKMAFRLRISENELEQQLTSLTHWLYQDDINVISQRYQDDDLETERERETERETTKKPLGPTNPPDELPVNGELSQWAQKNGITVDLKVETDKCLDWHRANGKRRKDWEATRRNWLRRAQEFSGGATPDPGEGAI